MTVEECLTEPLIDDLAAAVDRDVSIELAGVESAVQERIQAQVPEASTFESLWDWSETPAGRLMMVDGHKTLVSVLTNRVDEPATTDRFETAIWGEGATNSPVVVLRATFTNQLHAEESE
jgi:hypothetical protein